VTISEYHTPQARKTHHGMARIFGQHHTIALDRGGTRTWSVVEKAGV
jgi:hypothetical protein